ncbi:MAG: PAS domain S-box protein [Kangiellaceae bacterium]|nr:PAS domain S-box protein [Kangiellaceae bacterium]
MQRTLSLKACFSILVLTSFLFFICVVARTAYISEKEHHQELTDTVFKQSIMQLSDDTLIALANKDQLELKSLFEKNITRRNFVQLAIINSSNQVINLSPKRKYNSDLLSLDHFELRALAKIRNTRFNSTHKIENEKKIISYSLLRQNSDTPNGNHGNLVLFAVYFMDDNSQQIWLSVRNTTIEAASIFIVLLIFLILLFYRFMLQPFSRINDTLKENSTTEQEIKNIFRGESEFNSLLQAILEWQRVQIGTKSKLVKQKEITENILVELEQRQFALDQHSIVDTTDVHGVITYVNDKFCTSSGYAKHELIGKTHRIINSNFHNKEFFDDIYRTITKGFIWQGEIRNKAKNGSYYWLENTIVPFLGLSGSVESYVTIRTDISKRKSAQKQLVENEQRFNLAMSVANDGIWDWDLVSDSVVFDNRYYTMAGYFPLEFSESFAEWKKRIHPQHKAEVVLALNQYIDGKSKKFSEQFRFKTKSGAYIWIQSKGEFVAFDSQGKPTRLIGTHRDITETRDALQALTLSEKNLLLAQSSAKIGHFSVDILNDRWTSSLELENIFGLALNATKNFACWINIVHSEDRLEIEAHLKNDVLTQHKNFNKEYRIVNNKNGEILWVHALGQLSMDHTGLPVELFGTIQDISKQKSVQLALQHSRDKQALLVNTIPYGIQEIDLSGNVVFANQIFYRLFESSEEQVIGTPFWSLLADNDKSIKLRQDFEMLIKRQPTPNSFTTKKIISQGRTKILETVWDYQRDSKGSILGFISVVSDITQQRISEQALQRKQKMEAIGQLTGGIAHDFNNILGIIIGNLEMLAANLEDDEFSLKRIEAADKAAMRARNLTKQLLGFSRENTKLSSVTNVNQLIDSIDDVFYHSLGPEVKLEFYLSTNLWNTKIDREEMQDALVNMLINARDALEGKGTVTVSTSNVDTYQRKISTPLGQRNNLSQEASEFVCISISDTGCGIEADQQQKIFDPFFTTKEQGKGTGLGLAMVFGFIKRSGGFIELDSKINEGTRFNLYLPRTETELIEKQEETNLISRSNRIKGTETILVVDDEEDLADLARVTLQSQGYTVLVCDSAKKAIKHLESLNTIDLVFSDIVMPGGLSGFQLAKEVTNRWPNTQTLLTSGYEDKAVKSQEDKLSRQKLLRKPYTQLKMSTTIRTMLDCNNELNVGEEDNNRGVES